MAHRDKRIGESTKDPDRRYEEFAKENADWDRKVEEALTEIDKTSNEPASNSQPARA